MRTIATFLLGLVMFSCGASPDQGRNASGIVGGMPDMTKGVVGGEPGPPHRFGLELEGLPCMREAWSSRPSRRDLRSEEHTSELQSLAYLVCRLLLEKKK